METISQSTKQQMKDLRVGEGEMIIMAAILDPSHNLYNLLLLSCFYPHLSSVLSMFSVLVQACAVHQTFVC